tara:strand:+ start:466 stop:2475 length:2010 start_codon:yes stop_codon:yes gene_type:complete
MATLSGQTIANRYSSLLKTASDSTLTASLTAVEDGAGNDSDLSISTNKVKASTTLGIGTDPSIAKLHINAGAAQAITVDNGNASFVIGKGTQYSFCIGDCNPVATVGGGTSSTAAQANSNYISSNTATHSSAGAIVIMNGSATGAIGLGKAAPASGFIEIGTGAGTNHQVKVNAPPEQQGFDVYTNGQTLLSINGSARRIGLGEDVIAPTTTVEIGETGTAKTNTDILAITNKVNAADMDGTRTSVLFNQWYYDASTPAVADAARIAVGTETDWTSSTATQDAYMGLETAADGTVAERVRITSAGDVGVGTSSPTEKLHVVGNIFTTGTITTDGGVVDNSSAGRYELEDYFKQRPQANGSIGVATNIDFELAGAGTPTCTFDSNHSGIYLTTTTSNGDEAFIMPHEDSNQTAWYNGVFEATDELIWECAITTHETSATAEDNVRYHAGLFSGHTELVDSVAATSIADYAFFFYDSADTTFPNQTDNTKWHFAYGNNGIDYVTKLDFTLAENTTYRFKITTNGAGAVKAYVNGDQVGLTQVGDNGATGNTTVKINNAGGYGTGGETTMTVDNTDATTKIVIGDVLTNAAGVIIGTVKSVTATEILVHSISRAVADNDDLYIFGNKAASTTTAGVALKAATPLYPQIGVVTRTTAARYLHVHYQKLSRNLK